MMTMMSFPQRIFTLSVLFCFGAAFTRPESDRHGRASCTSSSPVCYNCSTLMECAASPVALVYCSDCGFACGEGDINSPLAACYTGLDNTDPSMSTNGVCLCKDTTDGSNLKNEGYQDPYDPNSYVMCINGNPTYYSCQEGNIYYEITQSCVQGEDCEDVTTGYIEDPLQCNTYIDCNYGGIRDNCPTPDLVFDEEIAACIDPMDSACDAATGGTISPHSDVCYMSVLCLGSPLALENANCCERGQKYDTGCVDDPCVPPPLCIQEYWEQLYCNQCNGSEIAYPVRDICSSYYYQCQDDGNGEIIPTLTECPPTYPVFNPVELYCDSHGNVAECSVTTTTTTL